MGGREEEGSAGPRSDGPRRGHDRPGLVVAIDGPAGAGKSTLARRLARATGLPYLNTGAMYRAVAHRALGSGADLDDERRLADLAGSIRFDIDASKVPPELAIDGHEPDPALDSAEIDAVVSRVSRHPAVRLVLRRRQRALALPGGIVEGRDIGTDVFPDAPVKIQLTAAPAERAGRRLQQRGGDPLIVEEAVARRDTLDERTTPTVPLPGRLVVDTTDLSPDEVLDLALRLVREAAGR